MLASASLLAVVAVVATVVIADDGADRELSVRNGEVVLTPPLLDPPVPAHVDEPAAGPAADLATTTSTTAAAATTSTTRASKPAVPAPAKPASPAPVPKPAAVPTQTGLYVVNADSGALVRVAGGRVHDPVWSPEGNRILFHRDNQLFVVGADGAGESVVAGNVSFRAAWSPDGTSIAFISGGSLFVARPDGSGPRQVAEGGVLAVDWSPDGNQLALVGMIPMQNRLEVVRPDGTERRILTTTIGIDGKVAWSPDSTRLAYLDYNRGPAVIEVATGKITTLTTQRNMGWRMSWSRAGDEVAFADYRGSDNVLSVGRADGSGVRTLVTGAVAPAWSPSGGRIAFQGNRSPDSRGELLTHLYVVDPNGHGERVLVSDTRSTHVDEPAWAPDSIRIAFAFAT